MHRNRNECVGRVRLMFGNGGRTALVLLNNYAWDFRGQARGGERTD